jgi:hypothetical protein
MLISRGDTDRMGRNGVYIALLAIFAVGGHAYAAFKSPKIYWRISKWFWYFLTASVFIAFIDTLLIKVGWLYGLRKFYGFTSIFGSTWLFVLPCGFAWFCAIPYFVLRAKTQADWNSWPTFIDYCESRKIEGSATATIDCHSCGNQSIRNIGFEKASDNRRLHVCNQCSTSLYRSLQG